MHRIEFYQNDEDFRRVSLAMSHCLFNVLRILYLVLCRHLRSFSDLKKTKKMKSNKKKKKKKKSKKFWAKYALDQISSGPNKLWLK